jgi:hypothetical protein
MNVWLIVLLSVAVVVIVAGLALNPLIRKAGDKAIARCWERLDRNRIRVIEPRAVGFASEPDEAGGLRGQGCLAVNDEELLFVTTAGQKEYAIARSAITGVDTSGDPRSPLKATITVTYGDAEHGEVNASWRVPDVPDWLRELGYDWGPEGPPPVDADPADSSER